MSLKQEHLVELEVIIDDYAGELYEAMRAGNRAGFAAALASIRRAGTIGLEIGEHLNGARARKNAGDRKRRSSSKKSGAPKKVKTAKKTPGKPRGPSYPAANRPATE